MTKKILYPKLIKYLAGTAGKDMNSVLMVNGKLIPMYYILERFMKENAGSFDTQTNSIFINLSVPNNIKARLKVSNKPGVDYDSYVMGYRRSKKIVNYLENKELKVSLNTAWLMQLINEYHS